MCVSVRVCVCVEYAGIQFPITFDGDRTVPSRLHDDACFAFERLSFLLDRPFEYRQQLDFKIHVSLLPAPSPSSFPSRSHSLSFTPILLPSRSPPLLSSLAPSSTHPGCQREFVPSFSLCVHTHTHANTHTHTHTHAHTRVLKIIISPIKQNANMNKTQSQTQRKQNTDMGAVTRA